MTDARVRRGRPGHSLESLLDVAVATFNERGYDATSMDELAARLGVTKSAIYHHVPGKVSLLRLALDRALDALFAVTEEPGAVQGRAIDRLEHVVRGSIEVLVDEQSRHELIDDLLEGYTRAVTVWAADEAGSAGEPTATQSP